MRYIVKCHDCGVIGEYTDENDAHAARNRHITAFRHPVWINKKKGQEAPKP